jgi:CelD/BcsL family acetyltransferase involved in cellulose biosynthesis
VKGNLQIRVYDSLDTLEDLRPAWKDLLVQSPAGTIFSTLEWLVPWWHAFGADQQLHVLALFDTSSRLVGLAPLASLSLRVSGGASLRVIRLMGDGSTDSDNLDMPVLPGYEEECASALMAHLSSPEVRWNLCQLNTLPHDSAVGNILLRHIKDRRWTCAVSQDPRRTILLPETWEAYLQGLSYNERRNIGRYRRKLESRQKISVHKCMQLSELSVFLEELFELHQKRWILRGEPGTFASTARRQFYYEVGRCFLEQGWLEFWLLRLDGKAVAAQFDFRFRDVVYALQQGFDPAHYEDRVGNILRATVLEQLIAAGVRQYDFLGGQSPYKSRWYPQESSYLNIQFARPYTRGSLYLQMTGRAKASKEWLRRRLPSSAWAVLHRMNVLLRGLQGHESKAKSSE